MTTFVLVHGAWHGSWCWEHLTPELDALDHRSLAVELPSDDPAATFETYADVVVEAISGEDEDAVVVGHSLAKFCMPIVNRVTFSRPSTASARRPGRRTECPAR